MLDFSLTPEAVSEAGEESSISLVPDLDLDLDLDLDSLPAVPSLWIGSSLHVPVPPSIIL